MNKFCNETKFNDKTIQIAQGFVLFTLIQHKLYKG